MRGFVFLFFVARDVFFACFPLGLLSPLPGCHTCGIPSWGGSLSSLPISLRGARCAGPRGPPPFSLFKSSFASRCRSASLLLSPHPGRGSFFLFSATLRGGARSAPPSARPVMSSGMSTFLASISLASGAPMSFSPIRTCKSPCEACPSASSSVPPPSAPSPAGVGPSSLFLPSHRRSSQTSRAPAEPQS